MVVGYLVTLFPKLSESFVLNEVVALQRRGLRVVPVSLERSRRLEAKAHAAAGELSPPPHYALDGFPGRHLRALGYWVVRRPLALVRMAAENWRHPAPRGESKLGRFVAAAHAARLLERHRVDCLHAHWSYPCDVALLLSRFLGLPVSFTAHAHDIFEDIPLYEAAGFAFEERVRRARFVVACTRHNVEHLRSLLPHELHGRLHYGYHGLDVDRFAPRPRTANGVPMLLSVGRFVAYKGFDVIVRACERLHRDGREFRCLLAGPHGSQTEIVREQIRAAGLEHVVALLGPQTQEELLELYAAADVYVNASNPDGEYGVANVIVEALASGLPTIATVRPQVTEYVEHEVNGLLVPYGDDEALAAAIARLLDDQYLAARLGAAGRKTAEERFEIDATAALLDRLLRGGTAAVAAFKREQEGVHACAS